MSAAMLSNAGPKRLGTALALLALASGCRATSVAYRFVPSPMEILVQENERSPIVARVLVSIPGAEREGRTSDGYPLLVMRVRVENKSDSPVSFDPARAIVLGSDLAEFGVPIATPPGTVYIEPGAADSVLMHFPFPRDMRTLDAPLLTGINLQFELGHAGRGIEVSVSIERDEPEVIVDYGPAFTFGPGYYYYGRW